MTTIKLHLNAKLYVQNRTLMYAFENSLSVIGDSCFPTMF